MKMLERIRVLDKQFQLRRTPISMHDIRILLDNCSKSTAKRTLDELKKWGAPIYCRLGQGYQYDKNKNFQLLGVWFTPEELHALLSIQQLSRHLSGDALDMKPLEEKIQKLLGSVSPHIEEIHRIHVLGSGARSKKMPLFGMVTQALLLRKRISLVYHGRQKNEQSQRNVSPQRVVFYKGSWYLDAWCHKAKALRTFAVECIQHARLLDEGCKNIVEAEMDNYFTRSFGIFSGVPTHTAVLRFSPSASKWVKDEEWFPDVKAEWLADGHLELHIPYNNPTELIMDVCRYGAGVEVLSPHVLRQQVEGALRQALTQYS